MTFVSPSESSVFHRELDRLYPMMARGEGYRLFDDEGREYLDAVGGGAAVVNIGYGIKGIVDAIVEQAHVLPFVHNQKFTHVWQEELARELAATVPPYTKFIFCQGGGEANETALRLARSYHVERGEPNRWRIISFAQAYHGSTMATLALTGRPGLQYPYAPYLPEFLSIPPVDLENDPNGQRALEGLEQLIQTAGPETIAAFWCEPVSAAAAPAYSPPPEFFAGLADLSKKHGFLLGCDEVVTGIGRTGSFLAVQQLPFTPDIVTTAKGLGGGYVPMGAVMTTDAVYDAVASGSRDFSHGYTFNGYPMGCAVGLAILRHLREEALIDRVRDMGPRFKEILEDAVLDAELVHAVRGRGFLLGVSYRNPDGSFLDSSKRVARRIDVACLGLGLLVYSTQPTSDGYQGDQTMLTPSFATTESDWIEMTRRLRAAIDKVAADVHSGTSLEAVVG